MGQQEMSPPGNVTPRGCHPQGMSPAGMSAHPSGSGCGAPMFQPHILALLSLSQRCSLALPAPPPPVPFTTPFLPLSLASPPSQPLSLPPGAGNFAPMSSHPSRAQPRSRPLPWDPALAAGSAGKLLGWQASTWAHYGDMVITCLRGRAAPPAPGMLTGMEMGSRAGKREN